MFHSRLLMMFYRILSLRIVKTSSSLTYFYELRYLKLGRCVFCVGFKIIFGSIWTLNTCVDPHARYDECLDMELEIEGMDLFPRIMYWEGW